MLFGEMAARQDLDAGTGPGSLLVDLRRPAVLLREIELAGEQRGVIRHGPRAVDDDVLAPAVEDVAVRVGETDR